MDDFPRHPSEVTPAWLTDRLRARGILGADDVVSVSELGQPKADRTAAVLQVTYGGPAEDAPRRIFYKYNTNGRDRVAVKRHCAAVREATFYREIDPGSDRRIGPLCFDAGGDFENGEVYLLLEDTTERYTLVDKADTPSPYGGWASFETVPVDRFVAVAEALAGFQARWWDDPRIQQEDLCAQTGDMLNTIATATDAFVARTLGDPDWATSTRDRLAKFGERDPDAAIDLMRRVIEAWPGLCRDRIARGGRTLIHGDLHLRNVVFPKIDPGSPCFLDWEGLATGLGLTDLVHLVATSMLSGPKTTDVCEAMGAAYRAALAAADRGDRLTYDEDFRLSIVAMIPQAWDGSPFTRAVLSMFHTYDCGSLLN